MRKWRLWSRFENGKIVGGVIDHVRMFGFIAAFVLLIACINYMNMSTARSVKRAKEVGIRKVVGAGKSSLVGQFLWESILFAFLACILALIIVQPGLHWFNHLIDGNLAIPYGNPQFWLFMVGFVLFTGVLAGSYPAFYLSSFKPIRVIKGIFKGANALVTPRKVLVVFQFTFAIALIICTIVIYRQLVYGQQRDPGYDKNNLAYVYVKGDMLKNYQFISSALINSGAITAITRSNCPITDTWRWEDNYEWAGKKPDTRYEFAGFNTDHDFIKTTGLKLVDGRDIDIQKYPTDSTAVLLNESAARLMGFPDPIGQTLQRAGKQWHVVGVVKNFISVWPYQPDFPVLIQGPGYNNNNQYGALTFRLNSKHSTKNNLAKVAAVFKKYNPDYPFEYHFAEDSYAEKFEGEKFMGTLSAIFAGLTILISCLGLFALATYMAENRIKEIGIRKVLGASVTRITALLSKDFLKLVIISFVIASPVAWWAMNIWLSDYSYRVSISWWIFAVTGLISIVIAVTTVGYQAVKAALSNPVKSLRSE
jgi:ABC-type antimicrobial peptide transport system permease subunit